MYKCVTIFWNKFSSNFSVHSIHPLDKYSFHFLLILRIREKSMGTVDVEHNESVFKI